MRTAGTSGRSRRGLGIVLGVVMLVLLIGALVGIARKVQASRVVNTAMVASVGALALETAASALEEALVKLGERANTPGDDVYEYLRTEGLPAPRTFSIEVPFTRAQLAADPLTKTVEVESGGVSVEFLQRVQLGTASYEHTGRVRLTAAAAHDAAGIRRELVREYDLKVNLLSTPKVFDQLSWTILQPEPFLDPEGNPRIDRTVEAMKTLRDTTAPGLETQIRDLLTRVNEKLQEINSSQGGSYEMYDIESLVRPFNRDGLPQPPTFTTDPNAEYHYFTNEPLLYSQELVTSDLGRINLRPVADQRMAAVDRALSTYQEDIARYNRVKAELDQLANQQPLSRELGERVDAKFEQYLEEVRKVGERTQEVATELQGMITLYHDYMRDFPSFVPEHRTEVLKFAPQLDAAYYTRTAQHIFRGPDSVDRCIAFLRRYLGPASSPDEKLHASIYIENESPLDFDRLRTAAGTLVIKGKLLIAASGDVNLHDIKVGDESTDLFVVVAGGKLKARGAVHGSLIANSVELDSDLALRGNLMIRGVTDPAALRGRLDNSGFRYFSGVQNAFKGAYVHAALAPYPVASTVERK